MRHVSSSVHRGLIMAHQNLNDRHWLAHSTPFKTVPKSLRPCTLGSVSASQTAESPRWHSTTSYCDKLWPMSWVAKTSRASNPTRCQRTKHYNSTCWKICTLYTRVIFFDCLRYELWAPSRFHNSHSTNLGNESTTTKVRNPNLKRKKVRPTTTVHTSCILHRLSMMMSWHCWSPKNKNRTHKKPSMQQSNILITNCRDRSGEKKIAKQSQKQHSWPMQNGTKKKRQDAIGADWMYACFACSFFLDPRCLDDRSRAESLSN